MYRRAGAASPASLTGPNLLQNNNFALDADDDGLPDGWTAFDRGGVRFSDFRFQAGAPGRAVQIDGINNYLLSPFIAVQPANPFRIAFRALADNPEKPSPTRVRVRFHWFDAEGVEFSNERGRWQEVPHRNWATISDTAVAPEDAARLRISIHPASDDRIVIDELGLGQLGVYIAPWPDGKQAALALSFDYETAMGGLIHSRSDDPYASANPEERGRRMRQGAEKILTLFQPAQIRGTWYTNGYNFLTGNEQRREFMGDPIYEDWATQANGWPSDHWAKTPWFAPDPHSDERSAPEWYFGSQIAALKAAGQDIQSHTFAHFAGGLVVPDDWRADFAAWRDVAGAMDVPMATSLAFPWSWSAGMRWDSWEVLEANGITSLTRTNWRQPRFQIADRRTYGLRRLPGHDTMTVIADEYLTPGSLPRVLERLELARLNQGAIDLWAHTEEVSTPAQREAWATVIAAREPFWIAPVPEIVAWDRALERISVRLEAEQPRYVFHVRNDNRAPLHKLTLVLPYTPAQVTVDGVVATAIGDRLVLDVPARASVEVILWPA
jgi:hypothetical protein